MENLAEKVKPYTTNFARLSGSVLKIGGILHEEENEKFYEITLQSKRLSGQADEIPVAISQRLIPFESVEELLGKSIKVDGEFRSYNKMEEGKSKLKLYLCAREVLLKSQEEADENQLFLHGTICKPTVYRLTPFGTEICDGLVAVNRPNGTGSDYIPIIAWKRNARFLKDLSVGDVVELTNCRMQSRTYSKEMPNGEKQVRTAYEVSCGGLALVQAK